MEKYEFEGNDKGIYERKRADCSSKFKIGISK